MKTILLACSVIFALGAVTDRADDEIVAAAAEPGGGAFGGSRGGKTGGPSKGLGGGGGGDRRDDRRDDRQRSPWNNRGRDRDDVGLGFWHKLDLGLGIPNGYYCPPGPIYPPLGAPGPSGWQAPIGAPAPQCFCPVRQQLSAPGPSWAAPPLSAPPPQTWSAPLSAPPPQTWSAPLAATPPLLLQQPSWEPPLQAAVPPIYYAVPPPLQAAPPTWAAAGSFRRLRGDLPVDSARAPSSTKSSTKNKSRSPRSLYYDAYGRDIGGNSGGSLYPPNLSQPALQGPIICICPL